MLWQKVHARHCPAKQQFLATEIENDPQIASGKGCLSVGPLETIAGFQSL
jgi:hypothetical protein